MSEFNGQLERHRPRLQLRLDPAGVHKIGQEFAILRRMYRSDEQVRSTLDSIPDTKTTFEVSWTTLGPQLPRLQKYCGDLASAFPNTAIVDSDFYVLGWEKDEYRHSLTDFSFQGIVHAKQYRNLQRLDRFAQPGRTPSSVV
ncbi:hypothetical protein ON010_g18435 [Phytophthora cinnamomi]|nr:hypothetical protein ON010_g18435 [Phytophthora cinnamomi]